jgi:hypothetical protein
VLVSIHPVEAPGNVKDPRGVIDRLDHARLGARLERTQERVAAASGLQPSNREMSDASDASFTAPDDPMTIFSSPSATPSPTPCPETRICFARTNSASS